MNQSVVVSAPIARNQPKTEAKAFDPWLLWVTLRRCWYWAVPVGLVLACLAAFSVLATFEPRFRAQHLIEANQDYILYRDVFNTVRDLAGTEKTIFFDEIVLRPVLSDPELRAAPSLSDPEEAERNIRKNLNISHGGSRARMIVSYEDANREYAAKVCNAIVEAYMMQRKALDGRRVAILEELLDPEIDHWKGQVEQHKARVRELTIGMKGYDPGSPLGFSRNESRLALLNGYESQINDLRVDIFELEGKLQLEEMEQANHVKEDAGEFVPEAFIPPPSEVTRNVIGPGDIANYVNSDESVVEALQQIGRYEAQIVRMEDLGTWRLNQTHFAELKKKRDEWEATLKTAKAAAETKAATELEALADADYEHQQKQWEEKVAALRAAHEEKQRLDRQNRALVDAQLRTETTRQYRRMITEKKEKIKIIQRQLDQESEKFTTLLDDSAKLQFAQDDLRRASLLLNKLEDRKAAIKTERTQADAVRSVSPATPPGHPVEDIPVKKLLVASGGAFAIPLLLGLLWEFKTNRVTDTHVLDSSQAIAPVIGELARSPSTTASRGSKGRRIFQESVDTMRANIFLSKHTQHSRSIAIVSSMSGEGKSTAASQLAISLAKSSGKTVLLVDADMRCPDQHDHFGISLEPGLSGVLTNQATLDEAIQTELGDLIHILPAGRLKASPHRLMSPESMKSLVSDILDRYEYVIFDTAPVLSAGETLSVAASVDTTLVCAMRDVTRMDSVIRTTHRLESAGANVAGTIFSGVTPRQYAYRYGDYNYSNFTNLPGSAT
ncbi:Tyrosine-protein kinase YwqD [Stieleria maiorica]|uniref:Tyrosine-protein kinase YwqD n=1 Tax=Stieleria maiorica TaxID=2795974 RepID=A0A5B9ML17_9BACT|nr:polysaccharide biosynthesis tyrosine autokinase [Stieleria maiorica]QEF99607.1 Tyrosine-protein kinase YwqD [Stieleria maiorica]